MVRTRAVDPHLFYTNPDPAIFLNADPDPNADPEQGLGLAKTNLKKKN